MTGSSELATKNSHSGIAGSACCEWNDVKNVNATHSLTAIFLKTTPHFTAKMIFCLGQEKQERFPLRL